MFDFDKWEQNERPEREFESPKHALAYYSLKLKEVEDKVRDLLRKRDDYAQQVVKLRAMLKREGEK